jgi:hypothetical protein
VLKKVAGVLILSLGAMTAANASPVQYVPKHTFLWFYGMSRNPDVKKPMVAPEIDPASALSGMTLLLGGLAVVRGRRAQK